MKYITTRHSTIQKTLTEAILAGLAEDGGLFVPATFPKINIKEFAANVDYPAFAATCLQPFFAGDLLEKHLQKICHNALSFSIPLKQLAENDFVLELFHGPTLSFKDVGARFLAECLAVIASEHPLTIMVATSGDTGSAVASAFHQKKNINVVILYPDGQISKRQEQQITCWDDNVLALAVDGNFDDCQRLVKAAFQDPAWQHLNLSSANSINVGRLLPQMTYYAFHSLRFYRQHNAAPGFIIPTGNLGNATAAYWAKMLGFPIREIVLATNANQAIEDYLQTGEFKPRKSIATLANAMDVGNPSNFERLKYLYPDFNEFKNQVKAVSVSDEDIKRTIKRVYEQYHMLICPHTATAFFAREQFAEQLWIMVATADPCKFEEIIEPIVQVDVPVVPQMQSMLEKPAQTIKVAADLREILELIERS